jgi:Met-zincin/Domain of unknown function (DUF5117)
MKFLKSLIFCLLFLSVTIFSQSKVLPTIKNKTEGLKKYSGYFNFYWDSNEGKIWLEVDHFDDEFLLVNSLSHGVGSNDLGLDRGQIGNNRIVKFEKFGNKILLIQPNYSFRAITNNADERKDVNESFAESVLYGFPIAAEENGNVLIDITPLLLSDMHGVIQTLKELKQGNYKLDQSRSAVDLDYTKDFPLNSEFETVLTYTDTENAPGRYVSQVVPTPDIITVHEHYSFIKLPNDGYEAREYDPRAGYFGISFMDYAVPIGHPVVKRYIIRHNLRKKNPEAEISEPVKPIVYYVDNGAPEPIRSALIEGASWWNQAFEAAGFKNAFIVKVLPDSADPMDVRYNVIQWVHRSTRGWSYGGSVIDPRTGEIIQGRVTLGSLRVRQDYLIAEGLLAPYKKGKPVSDEMLKMSLARIRQLAAHETGHTLGLAHNFAASISNRASVMDYPHPLIKIDKDSKLDLSDAYAVGIGSWDKRAIIYGYSEFPAGTNEKEALNKIIDKTISSGLMYISDEGARPLGSAHPFAHLWDNNSNPVDELNRIMKVRKIALDNFSENNIQEGQPMATLENVLVPVYLLHRYQLEAAAKSLGGLYYTYAVRGDGQKITEIVSADRQREALDALLNTLKPSVLELPERILKLIPPQPPGYDRTSENFVSNTGLTFDPLAAAAAAAEMTVRLILQPQRDARLIEYNSRDSSCPSLSEVIDKLVSATILSRYNDKKMEDIEEVIDNIVLNHLMSLARAKETLNEVNAIALFKLKILKKTLTEKIKVIKNEDELAHYEYLISKIDNFEKNPDSLKEIKTPEIPEGQPIGSDNTFVL